MRYAFVRENTVEFIEDSGVPLSQKYHTGIHHYFIPIPEGQEVKIGDYYNDGVFTRPLTWKEAEALKERTTSLETQVTDTQLALCEMFESIGGAING